MVEVYFPDVPGIPDGFDEMKKILEDILPSHLEIQYKFWYITWALMEERFDTWGDIEAHLPHLGGVGEDGTGGRGRIGKSAWGEQFALPRRFC